MKPSAGLCTGGILSTPSSSYPLPLQCRVFNECSLEGVKIGYLHLAVDIHYLFGPSLSSVLFVLHYSEKVTEALHLRN